MDHFLWHGVLKYAIAEINGVSMHTLNHFLRIMGPWRGG